VWAESYLSSASAGRLEGQPQAGGEDLPRGKAVLAFEEAEEAGGDAAGGIAQAREGEPALEYGFCIGRVVDGAEVSDSNNRGQLQPGVSEASGRHFDQWFKSVADA